MISNQVSRPGSQSELWQWLREVGERPATLSTLIELFNIDADRFFDLAMSEVFGIELEPDDKDGMFLD